MKISEIKITNFKRFSNLTVTNIPREAKLVIIVGPNGSGKSSIFDAFNQWYRKNSGRGHNNEDNYYRKNAENPFSYDGSVQISFHSNFEMPQNRKKMMYFRTAYRNDPDFNITSFSKIGDPGDQFRFNRLIDNDIVVSQNYQRLLHNTIKSVYHEMNDEKCVKDLREELIGSIRSSMTNVFKDLVLNNIGDPLSDGAFFFEKGDSKSFHYKNLSGGEKAAFDLLLDFIIKKNYYDNSIYCIDEPEIHIHTRLQGSLLEELYNVIPENGQLWITTHSLGIMQKAKELSNRGTNKVVFLDFDENDFDDVIVLQPSSIDRIVWEKFLSIALDDLGKMILPNKIFLCEGNKKGRKNKNFDSQIYSHIFKKEDVMFVSAGGCNEIEDDSFIGYLILSQVCVGRTIKRLIDRDERSDEEIEELNSRNVTVLRRRHIESYLMDDEIIIRLVEKYTTGFLPDKIESLIKEALEIKQRAIDSSMRRGHSNEDIKSATGEMCVELKRLLNLTNHGNTTDAFLKDTITPLITEETNVYKELREQILGG